MPLSAKQAGLRKNYIALFGQTGAAIPVTQEIENNTGLVFPAWTSPYPGFYKMSIPGSTPNNVITPFGNWDGNAGTYQVISDQSTVLGYVTYYIGNPGELWLEVYNPLFVQVDFSTLFGSAKIPIELKLYL